VKLLQRAALWTDEAMAKDIFLIATNSHYLFLWIHGDFKSARGFTQRAGSKNGAMSRISHDNTLPRHPSLTISVRTLIS
jgi:hypothetical protein